MTNPLTYIFPIYCVGCGAPLHRGALCPDCEARFETECRALCPLCHSPHKECRCPYDAGGMDLPPEPTVDSAGTATVIVRSSPVNDRAVFHLAEYTAEKNAVADKIILSSKNGKNRRRADFIARHFAALLAAQRVLPEDLSTVLITNVPRRRAAIAEHGCDQAEDFAVATARALGVKYKYALMHIGRAEQKTLGGAERLRNARASYKLRHDSREEFNGRVIVLIDDIVTSGSSMSVCADLLIEAGAERVICLCIGRRYKK